MSFSSRGRARTARTLAPFDRAGGSDAGGPIGPAGATTAGIGP